MRDLRENRISVQICPFLTPGERGATRITIAAHQMTPLDELINCYVNYIYAKISYGAVHRWKMHFLPMPSEKCVQHVTASVYVQGGP